LSAERGTTSSYRKEFDDDDDDDDDDKGKDKVIPVFFN